MCNWIKVSDRLPECGPRGRGPLILWDSYDEEAGEVQLGYFGAGKFGVYEMAVDNDQLNITYWAEVTVPED